MRTQTLTYIPLIEIKIVPIVPQLSLRSGAFTRLECFFFFVCEKITESKKISVKCNVLLRIKRAVIKRSKINHRKLNWTNFRYMHDWIFFLYSVTIKLYSLCISYCISLCTAWQSNCHPLCFGDKDCLSDNKLLRDKLCKRALGNVLIWIETWLRQKFFAELCERSGRRVCDGWIEARERDVRKAKEERKEKSFSPWKEASALKDIPESRREALYTVYVCIRGVLSRTTLRWASIAAWRETRWKRRGIAQRQGLKFSRATRESGGLLRLPKSAIWRTYLPGWRIRGKRSGPEEDAKRDEERKRERKKRKRPLLVEKGGQPPTEWTTC